MANTGMNSTTTSEPMDIEDVKVILDRRTKQPEESFHTYTKPRIAEAIQRGIDHDASSTFVVVTMPRDELPVAATYLKSKGYGVKDGGPTQWKSSTPGRTWRSKFISIVIIALVTNPRHAWVCSRPMDPWTESHCGDTTVSAESYL